MRTPMSPLADVVYAILRQRVPSPRPQLTDEELAGQLPLQFADVVAHDSRLWAALGEIVHACHAHGLPALSAIVVRAAEGTPGAGYFPVAHPKEAGDRMHEIVAWGNEIQKVMKSTYPPTL